MNDLYVIIAAIAAYDEALHAKEPTWPNRVEAMRQALIAAKEAQNVRSPPSK